ncbi:DUF2059 domain-containing protein [Alteripontixanthobacter maritimus]|uniref:hypothetical protein n=1 Tax=Alteripontixanthobacter maritimus TaxID=2161824 RepID=UPI000E1B8B90|nr:hypothetical protein [Alteripontixanthobacter maritimus]
MEHRIVALSAIGAALAFIAPASAQDADEVPPITLGKRIGDAPVPVMTMRVEDLTCKERADLPEDAQCTEEEAAAEPADDFSNPVFSPEDEAEMAEAFGIFRQLFPTTPLTTEQEALLPQAEKLANDLVPDGSYARIMQDTMEPIFSGIFGDLMDDPASHLVDVTGLEEETFEELEDTAMEQALALLDPRYKERNRAMGEALTGLMGELMGAIEPALRTGYSRALVKRFDAAELATLSLFFDTPTGGKFARELLPISADPEVMGAMEAMGPAMVGLMPQMMEEFEAVTEEYGEARAFSDLTAAEQGQLASLLGKAEAELRAGEEALNSQVEVEEEIGADATSQEA